MEEKILIQAFAPYSFKDEKGLLREGISVFYLANSSKEKGQNAGKFGYFPVRENLPIDFLDKLKFGIGFYTQTIGLKSVKGKNGYQNVATTVDLKFLEKFDIK